MLLALRPGMTEIMGKLFRAEIGSRLAELQQHYFRLSFIMIRWKMQSR